MTSSVSFEVITYLGLSARWGHRPTTVDRQRVQSCAILSSWFQLQPVWRASESRYLLQVFLGFTLFCFPWGFQVRAWRVMLVGSFVRVCPIHLHLRYFISSSTSSCPVLCQRYLLLMVSGQKILNIFRRQPLLIIFFVVLQVSEPYKSTGFTLELKNRSFVLVLTYAGTSTSDTGAVFRVLTLISFNFSGWIFRPTWLELVISPVVFSWIRSWLCDRRATSSAKSRCSSWFHW